MSNIMLYVASNDFFIARERFVSSHLISSRLVSYHLISRRCGARWSMRTESRGNSKVTRYRVTSTDRAGRPAGWPARPIAALRSGVGPRRRGLNGRRNAVKTFCHLRCNSCTTSGGYSVPYYAGATPRWHHFIYDCFDNILFHTIDHRTKLC